MDGSEMVSFKAAGSDTPKMEDSIINLPVLANGVVALGDLWDCRSLTCPGTILNEPLTGQYAECHPMQALDYTLRKIKNTSDKLKTLFVSAEIKLEMTQGVTIKVEGSASYDATEHKKFNQEELQCEYLLHTYKLRLRPNVKNIFNQSIVDKITGENPAIAATHYVQEVVIGAHVVSKIKYSDNVEKDNLKIEGSFKGEFVFGPVSVDVKLELKMLDNNESEFYDVDISLKASPPLKSTPTCVEVMFEEIEKMHETVQAEQHYKELFPGKEIYGVPLSFKLAPLSQLFDESLIGTYEIMKQEIMDRFLDMVCNFQDFQAPDYLKSLILEQCRPLVTILSDPHNSYTQKITEQEIEYMKESKLLKTQSFILFGKYKEGEVTEEALDELVAKNDEIFNLPEIYEKVNAYVREGKQLLTAIHASDTLSPREEKVDADGEDCTTRVQFFTNKEDLHDWWSQERTIKILMQTKAGTRGGSTSGTFIQLFDMTSALVRRHNVEVGIALPNISDSYSLTFKVGSREVCYPLADGQLQFALEVLAIAIDKGPLMPSLFHSINNAISGVYQPYDLRDINSLIAIMKQYNSITICESYIQTLEQISGDPNKWLFVLPVEASHSGTDAVRFYRQLRQILPAQEPGLEHKWIVGRFQSQMHEAPLLLAFHNGELQAVCMDHLDILILMEQFKALRNTTAVSRGTRALLKLNPKSRTAPKNLSLLAYPEFAIISPQNIRPQCFYPQRANFILPHVENLVIHQHQTYLYDPVEYLETFKPLEHLHLSEAIELTRMVCHRREVQVLSALTRHAINNTTDPNLETDILMPGEAAYGWRSSDKMFVSTSSSAWDWAALSRDIDRFITKLQPHLDLIQLGILDLTQLVKDFEYVPPKEDETTPAALGPARNPREVSEEELKTRLEKILKPILDSSDEEGKYTDLKVGLERLKDCDDKMKLYASLNLYQVFYARELAGEEFYYLKLLKILVDNLAAEANTIKPLYQLLVDNYVRRLLQVPGEPNSGIVRAEAVINEADFPGVPERLTDAVADQNFYRALSLLVKTTYGADMFKLQLQLYNLSSVTNVESMKSAIEGMYEWKFGNDMKKDVWLNTKFSHWIRYGLNNVSLLETIKFRVCTTMLEDGTEELEIPRWLPHEIAEKLKPLFYGMVLQDYPWNKEWTDLESVVQVFQAIVTRRVLPLGFMALFRDVMEENVELRQEFKQVYKILYFWNEEEMYFEEPWSVRNVAVALEILMGIADQVRQAVKEQAAATLNSSADLNLLPKKGGRSIEEWIIELPEEEGETKPISVNASWLHLAPADGKVPVTTHKAWNVIAALPSRPSIQNETQLPSALKKIIPYLLTAFLKVSDTTDLAETSRVASFLNYLHWTERQSGPRPGYIEFLDSDEEDYEQVKKFLLSRGDLLTAACANLSDPLLTLHFCRTLLQQLGTRIALPVVVPSIGSGSNGAKSLLPLLRQIYVPSNNKRDGNDNSLGPAPAYHPRPLLDDKSKFITFIRVGGGRIGKSSFLNQHFVSDDNFFSCRLESGCEYGPPVQRSGLVEFTQLSRFTAHSGFWDTFGTSIEASDSDVYLANLHGDALELGATLNLLDHYTSSFVVFWRVANWDELKAKKKELNALIGNRGHILHMIIDPDETVIEQISEDNQNIIYTSKLYEASTPGKLYNVFKEALKCIGKLTDNQANVDPSIEFISIKTPQSTALLEFIQDNTASTIRQLFQLVQTTLRACEDDAEYKAAVTRLLNDNPILSRVLTLFIAVLNLPLATRFQAFTHLQTQLDQMSQLLRQRYVDRIVKLETRLLSYIKEATRSDSKVGLEEEYVFRIQEQIKGVRHTRDSMNLDLPQFWKQLDYVIPLHVPQVHDHYLDTHVQLVKLGWAIQMDDGDDGAQNPELYKSYRQQAIWHILMGSEPFLPRDTRVFVISVLGLRSSGKSTLLNSIFGNSCGAFPVGLAGCTNGLIMRIHKLSPALSAHLKLDVILVIDSEGLASAESYLDDAANVYERELATFLLGISHLTLVHVVDARKGRGFDELAPILQIALTTLTTMEKEQLQMRANELDLLFVHEPHEDWVSDGGEPAFLVEFKENIDALIQFTQAKDNELLLGVKTGMTDVLNTVVQRVMHDEIVFNTAASTSAGGLLNKILDICSQSTEERVTIGDWYEFKNGFYQTVKKLGSGRMPSSTQSALAGVTPRNVSPLLYRDLVDLQNDAELLRKTSNLKRLIDLAYRFHDGVVEDEIEARLEELFYNDESLKPYPSPSELPSREVCQDKTMRMKHEMEKQGSFLWKTINTCDANANANSKRRTPRDDEGGSSNSDSESCRDCLAAYTARESLIVEIKNNGYMKQKKKIELIDAIATYQIDVRDTIWSRIQQKVFSSQLRYRCVLEMLPNPDNLQEGEVQPQELSEKEQGVFVSNKVTAIPAWRLIQEEVLQEYCAMPPGFIERVSAMDWQEKSEMPDLESIPAFDLTNYNRTTRIDSSSLSQAKSCKLNWMQNDWLHAKMEDFPAIITTEWGSQEFLFGMIRSLQNKMVEVLADFEVYCGERLEVNFQWEAHLCAILIFTKYMKKKQENWNENDKCPNHPLFVWGKIKEQENGSDDGRSGSGHELKKAQPKVQHHQKLEESKEEPNMDKGEPSSIASIPPQTIQKQMPGPRQGGWIRR